MFTDNKKNQGTHFPLDSSLIQVVLFSIYYNYRKCRFCSIHHRKL